jgi:hypothetical protein
MWEQTPPDGSCWSTAAALEVPATCIDSGSEPSARTPLTKINTSADERTPAIWNGRVAFMRRGNNGEREIFVTTANMEDRSRVPAGPSGFNAAHGTRLPGVVHRIDMVGDRIAYDWLRRTSWCPRYTGKSDHVFRSEVVEFDLQTERRTVVDRGCTDQSVHEVSSPALTLTGLSYLREADVIAATPQASGIETRARTVPFDQSPVMESAAVQAVSVAADAGSLFTAEWLRRLGSGTWALVERDPG